jgi:hypothetical protein
MYNSLLVGSYQTNVSEAAMDRLGKLFGRKTEQDGADTAPDLPAAGGPATVPENTPAAIPPAPDAAPRARETIRLGAAPAGEEVYGLKFVFDSGEARTFTKLPIAIGRSEESDLVLNDETVSMKHALVFYDERLREICILDQDSLNGVYIADQPTRKNVLYDGARLALGKTHLVYRDTGYIHPA